MDGVVRGNDRAMYFGAKVNDGDCEDMYRIKNREIVQASSFLGNGQKTAFGSLCLTCVELLTKVQFR